MEYPPLEARGECTDDERASPIPTPAYTLTVARLPVAFALIRFGLAGDSGSPNLRQPEWSRGIRCDVFHVGLFSAMITLTLDLPEALTAELNAAVEAGWFTSQAEAVRAAVRDLVSHRKLALLEKQQLADIDWAVNAAAPRP